MLCGDELTTTSCAWILEQGRVLLTVEGAAARLKWHILDSLMCFKLEPRATQRHLLTETLCPCVKLQSGYVDYLKFTHACAGK